MSRFVISKHYSPDWIRAVYIAVAVDHIVTARGVSPDSGVDDDTDIFI